MTDRSPRGPLSVRIEPYWVNPATIKGALAAGVGLIILFAPVVSAVLLRWTVGLALIFSGGSDLWFAIRRDAAGRGRALVEAVLALAFGSMLVLFPAEAIRTLAVLTSVYLVTRGLGIVGAALSLRRLGQSWGTDLVRGLVYVALSVVVFFMADELARGLVAALAAGSVIIGGVVLVYGIRKRSNHEVIDIDVASVTEMLNGWLHEQDIGDERRQRVGDGLFFEEPERSSKLASWWIMLMLSVAIATLGVIQDSTAVVIGAMLIAPLMVPILGTSAGIVNVWRGRVIFSALLVLSGAAAAVGLAFVIGQWVPIIVPLSENTQVASRVSPNLIDMMIALAAGAAGAYANVDDRVSDSIAGVAIAVALVPPLGVVGLTLQAGMFEDSLGALLLFSTNLVSIILSGAVVFFLTGYAPYRRIQESGEEIAAFLRTVALAAILIAIPLSLTADKVVSDTAGQRIAHDEVTAWLEGSSLEALRIKVEADNVEVFVTGPGDVPDLTSLERALSEGFATEVALRVEHAPTVVISTGTEGR